jgi:hypothetical protein
MPVGGSAASLDAVRGYEVVDLDAVSVENDRSVAPRRISP